MNGGAGGATAARWLVTYAFPGVGKGSEKVGGNRSLVLMIAGEIRFTDDGKGIGRRTCLWDQGGLPPSSLWMPELIAPLITRPGGHS